MRTQIFYCILLFYVKFQCTIDYSLIFLRFAVSRIPRNIANIKTNWNVPMWHIISQCFSFINHVVSSDLGLRPFFANLRKFAKFGNRKSDWNVPCDTSFHNFFPHKSQSNIRFGIEVIFREFTKFQLLWQFARNSLNPKSDVTTSFMKEKYHKMICHSSF
jgi:hypothetical protein